jgi:hypothetical protein
LLIIVELLAITVETFLSRGYQFDKKNNIKFKGEQNKRQKNKQAPHSHGNVKD